jgi:uncharacterized protein YprB with RNaseH-like and TPR domain
MVVVFDIETTGLDPYECEVILIGMKKSDKIKQWKVWEVGDEVKIIESAIKEIMRIPINVTIIGYNNLKFDVPFMLERLEILGKMKREYWSIYNRKWFDLYQFLGNDYRSLKLWLQRAGIERDHPELEGKQIPYFFKCREYEKIEQHNKDDLITSEKLFMFLKERNPGLIPFD